MPAALKSFHSLLTKRAHSLNQRGFYSTIIPQSIYATTTTVTSSSGARASFPAFFLPRRYNSNSKTKDRQLHDSFNGLLPRFFSLQNLFQQQGRQMLSDLFLNDVIVTEQLFTGIKLYTDLQNPLLQKYGFNVQDFFHGTKEAFIQIQKGLTVLHLMNNDLIIERKENYQLQETHMGLLRASLGPKLYSIVEKQLQEPIDKISDAFVDYILKINSLKLNSIVIEHVRTQLMEYQDEKGNSGETKIPNAESLIQYPVGSVLATVDVIFESDQLYEHCENRLKPKVKRTIVSKWRFQGCISGHIPLNWMIVSMRNYIKNSSLQK